MATGFGTILVAGGIVGIGPAVFHPESSRVARMASGGQHGMAQSLFQVGGNAGTALGPSLAALALPKGQSSIAWYSLVALLGMVLLTNIGTWLSLHRSYQVKSFPNESTLPAPLESVHPHHALSARKVAFSLAILVALMFSKFFYLASLISYYTFYLMSRFHLSVHDAQLHLSLFLGAVAAGTFIGGPVGDKIGRKFVIWCSILGVLPFTSALPYASFLCTPLFSRCSLF